MKFKGLLRDISGGLFVTSMVTAALVGIFFAGWKIAGLPFVPFDSFDWLTRVLPGRLLGFGIGIMVDVIRALHLGPTSETAKTAEHAIAIAGLFVMGVAGGAILFSILRTRRKVHPVFLGLVLGIVLAVPAMLISAHASETATVDPGITGGVDPRCLLSLGCDPRSCRATIDRDRNGKQHGRECDGTAG